MRCSPTMTKYIGLAHCPIQRSFGLFSIQLLNIHIDLLTYKMPFLKRAFRSSIPNTSGENSGEISSADAGVKKCAWRQRPTCSSKQFGARPQHCQQTQGVLKEIVWNLGRLWETELELEQLQRYLRWSAGDVCTDSFFLISPHPGSYDPESWFLAPHGITWHLDD